LHPTLAGGDSTLIALPNSIRTNTELQRFELPVDGGIAVLDYELRGNKLYLTHAGTPPESRGRGIAAEITREALEWAREQGLTVVPLCSFVGAYMRAHPEFSNLLE